MLSLQQYIDTGFKLATGQAEALKSVGLEILQASHALCCSSQPCSEDSHAAVQCVQNVIITNRCSLSYSVKL